MLTTAVYKRDIRSTKLLVESGADVNAMSSSTKPPLHMACLQGDERLAGYLLMKKARVNMQDSTGGTPLLCAVKSGSLNTVLILLRMKADPSIPNNKDEIPVFFSVAKGNYEITKALLEGGSPTEYKKRSALWLAVRIKCLPIVTLLLKHSASPNFVTSTGMTVMEYAETIGDRDCMLALLCSKPPANSRTSIEEHAMRDISVKISKLTAFFKKSHSNLLGSFRKVADCIIRISKMYALLMDRDSTMVVESDLEIERRINEEFHAFFAQYGKPERNITVQIKKINKYVLEYLMTMESLVTVAERKTYNQAKSLWYSNCKCNEEDAQ